MVYLARTPPVFLVAEPAAPAYPAPDDRVPPEATTSSERASQAPAGRSDARLHPDPFADADALEHLGDEIATLAAGIHAAEARLLALLADFDHRHGWELGGHRSCADWLHVRTGIDRGAARERVRAARALADLPETSASMARGELSFSKVRALTRVATADNEADLLELARDCTTAELERVVRAFRLGSRQSEAERERARRESRCFAVFPDGDGMYAVRGRLEPEVGAVLMRAVEAAADELYRERHVPGVEPDDDGAREASRRRADAVGLLAERALAAGFGDRAPVSGSRAERYQVLLHVDAATLVADGEPGRSNLQDGTRVSAETSRRLSCDASLIEVTHGPDDSVLGVGRRTRTIPPSLRRALEVRDGGCRFPGCGLRFTDGHHVKHWADGGETSLANTVLLCRHHHDLVHGGGWRMAWWGEGRPVFFDPRGGTHAEGRRGREEPRVVKPGAGVRDGPTPGPFTASARWTRQPDIPDGVYFRALEALGGS